MATWITEVSGTTYECPLCGSATTAVDDADIQGFPHADGLEDDDRTCWWPYLRCPDCEFELTYDLFSDYRAE